jgi:hypothetical protein
MVIGCGGSTPEVFTGVVVMAAMDLWWGGGGCDGSVMGIVVVVVVVTDLIGGFSGGVVMRCWRGCWLWRCWCAVDAVCDWLFTIQDSLTAFKSVEICRTLFWVSDGFQICWDLQVSWYLIGLFPRWCRLFRGGLHAETYLPRFPVYHLSLFLAHGVVLGF